MSRYKFCFLLVFSLFFINLYAQQKKAIVGNINTADSIIPAVSKMFTISSATFNVLNKPLVYSPQPATANVISQNYYTAHLGMMCKEELKLEKMTKLPLKIRLGSKDQVDYLEGKNYHH